MRAGPGIDTPETSEITERLQAARRLCQAAGERLSQPRLRVLERVIEAGGPVKAYDLADRLYGGRAASVITVYRALAFWARMGLVRKVETLNAFIATSSIGASAFLLCGGCGATEEIPFDGLGAVERVAETLGFKVDRLMLEAGGLCRRCAAKVVVVNEVEA